MNSVYMVMGSYLAVILIGFGIINWLSGGFLLPFARVKMSRGRKTLVRVHGVTGSHFLVGEIMEGWLVLKDRQKQMRRLQVSDSSYIGHAYGVKTIEIDDEKNAVLKPDFSVVTGYDAVKFENLYVRALTAPHLEDKTLKIILIVVVVLALLVVVNIFMTYKLGAKIDALNQVAAVASNVV